eukprot:scaffold18176_cov54-Cyclotella_meneghiniana.AAC.3
MPVTRSDTYKKQGGGEQKGLSGTKNEARWNEMYQQLVAFRKKKYKQNTKLASWVRTQRKNHKSKELIQDRVAKLNDIGFAWEANWNVARKELSKNERWNEMFKDLVDYKEKSYPEDRSLGYWVATQRSSYKNNRLSQDRIDKLNGIGFAWVLAKGHRQKLKKGDSSGETALQAERHQEEMEATCVSYQPRYPFHHHNSLLNDEVQPKLQEEIGNAMECMEASQLELSNEKIKSSELQESLEVTKKELEEKLALIEEYQSKVSVAEEEVKQLNATTLQSKISGLEQDMNVVKADLIQRDEHINSLLQERNLLQEKLKSVTDELVKAKCDHDEKEGVIEMIKEQYAKSTTQLKDDREKSEMLEKEVAKLKDQLENEKERTELANVELKKQQEEIDNMSAHMEVFKLKEEEFLFKISQLKQSLNAAQKVGRKSKNDLEARKGTASICDDKDQKAILRESLADSVVTENPNVRWDDVAGLEKAKESLKESVITPLQHPQLFTGKRKPFSGVLFYGPPGTGKTYLAKAVATEADTTFFCVSASDLVSKWQGESARLVRNLFEMARESPSRAIIFIDEVESLCRSRNESESNDERQTMTELLSQMDGVKKNKDKVFVLGATNLPWEIDPAMRRRFEKRIYIPLPGQEERSAMFKIHLAGVPNNLNPNDYIELGKSTEGLSGADIEVFVKDALYEPVRNCFDAKQFRQVGHYWMPCKNNPNCPNCLTDYKSTCERCGAKRMDYSDVPKGKLVAPDVTLKDFEKVWLAGKFATVSKDDTEEYTKWTTEFGRK